MKVSHEKIDSLLPLYLTGELDPIEIEMVEKHLEDCKECRDTLDSFKSLSKTFQEEELQAPSPNLRLKFLEALETEKMSQGKIITMNKKSNNGLNFMVLGKIAAGFAILVTAFMMGKLYESKESELEYALLENEALKSKEMAMLSLMENQSASKRIQGVNFIEAFKAPDVEVLNALKDRMLLDQNTNVRIAAVEALSNFSDSELVKSAFITALETEKNPSVQIAIIKNLVRVQEKKATAPMKKLLELEETQPFIKEEIKKGLPQII
ncbi:HEAT repeat domain-containing protein [Maribacter cobaltidurans]|uniref:Putative zinc-finger domain-containing protein n=1 Tax=Maribacter cobaltidurans TaxID=1178778 RepID=A0A223V3I2_9FLAO|nr:HEAT repeat domain-containing protein [Maribacter cobaltidurans]ASV29983.1 hypothetical protein CJ263_06970 [Maribacter cobaltidurans]GGD88165.1 hypothetical protein GCM10011412_27500 [Maribacter cobaltidurans]